MKLIATTEMIPVTLPEFGDLHPSAPLTKAKGYTTLLNVALAFVALFTY